MEQLDTELVSAKICPSCKRTFDGSDPSSFCPEDNSLLAIAPRDALLGKLVLEKYEIQELIGTGGWSNVYRAYDSSLSQRVAVKVMRMHLASEPDKVQRFQNEARSVRTLHHPNIAATFDYGLLNNGQPFLVMEHFDGITFRDAYNEGKFKTLNEQLQIFLQVCEALAEAHKIGVVHRDLKPTNIMIAFDDDKPRVKILDFGLAKVMMPEKIEMESLTRTGETLGTPPYMSPEQCTGGNIDGRSDIYSLGCMIFEAATGRLPFTGDSPFDCMVKHLRDEVPTFHSVCPGKTFPDGLEELVDRCMAKSADDRYQSVADLADDLAYVMKLKEGHNIRPHFLRGRKKKKSKVKLAIAAVLGVTLIGGAWAFMHFSSQNNPSVTPQDAKVASTSGVGGSNAARAKRTEFLKKIEELSHDKDDESARLMTCQELLDFDIREFGADSEEVADDHYKLGVACLDDDTTAICLEHFEKALARKRKIHGPDSPQLMPILQGMAECYYYDNDQKKELATLQEFARISEKISGADSLEYARSLEQIALSLFRQQMLEPALNFVEKSLAVSSKSKQPDAQLQFIDTSLLAIALEFKDAGRSKLLAKQAAGLIEHVGYPSSLNGSDYSRLMQELARVLGNQKSYAEAELVLSKLAFNSISPTGSGKSQSNSALIPYKIAMLQVVQNKVADAHKSFEQALVLANRSSGGRRGISPVAMSRLILTDYCEFLKKQDKAEQEKTYRAQLTAMGGPVNDQERAAILKASNAPRHHGGSKRNKNRRQRDSSEKRES